MLLYARDGVRLLRFLRVQSPAKENREPQEGIFKTIQLVIAAIS